MNPFYTDDWLTLYGGDCREALASLPADSVDCVVTSPPYWGLRDYGTATWTGGDETHEHAGMELRTSDTGGPKQQTKRGSIGVRSGDCACGATRTDSQLGLERTPEEYVANMVAVFREVRRVLKPSGTCWLNLGDSYATGGGSVGRAPGGGDQGERFIRAGMIATQPNRMKLEGLKPKDLVGIPWRVAFALQADGWYLRSDIIWSKPNPMPESVTDRPTKSHEYLFLLTKSPRYYFDADAVREASITNDARRPYTSKGAWELDGRPEEQRHGGKLRSDPTAATARNIRSVWTIATRPYPGAHFAVFPPELPERCIKAGSSEKGVCPECGAPWERVVERTTVLTRPGRASKLGTTEQERRAAGRDTTVGLQFRPETTTTTTGWRPTCKHGCECGKAEWNAKYGEITCGSCLGPAEVVDPAVILDPFGGSGTVGMVANRLSRRAILIDLNPEYLKQQMKRNAQTPLGLTEGDAA